MAKAIDSLFHTGTLILVADDKIVAQYPIMSALQTLPTYDNASNLLGENLREQDTSQNIDLEAIVPAGTKVLKFVYQDEINAKLGTAKKNELHVKLNY
jgi:hypothetical protein